MSDDTGRLVATGERLADRYDVLEHLGAGTRAYVVRARDRLTDEIVSCKLPLGGRDTDGHARALMEQYWLFRRLNSRHLQTLRNFEEHRTEHGAFRFLVFSIVDGQNAAEWPAGKPLRSRLHVLGAVAETLADLASEGAVHGDLDPSNIIVEPSGNVVLIDPDPQQFGSSVPRRQQAAVAPTADLGAFVYLVECFLPVGDGREAVASILRRLSADHPAPPAFSDISAAFRSLLALPAIPGETSTLAGAGQLYQRRVQDARSTTVRLCQQRDLAFRGLVDIVSQAAEPFGFTVTSNIKSDPPVTGADLLASELHAANEGRGQFVHRSVICKSVHGDELHLSLEGASSFRIPWPDPRRVGYVCRGLLVVIREHKPVLQETLELWMQGGTPRLFVWDTDAYSALDGLALERAMRVLAEMLFPGVPQATQAQSAPKRAASLQLHYMGEVRRYLGEESDDTERLRDAGRWMPVFLEMAMRHGSPRIGEPGGLLAKFFEHSREAVSARLEMVRGAASKFIERYGAYCPVLYRFDVAVVDEESGVLDVLVDVKVDCIGRRSHTVRVAVPTMQMVLAKARRTPRDGSL